MLNMQVNFAITSQAGIGLNNKTHVVWLFQISEILMPLAQKIAITLWAEAKIALLGVKSYWFR